MILEDEFVAPVNKKTRLRQACQFQPILEKPKSLPHWLGYLLKKYAWAESMLREATASRRVRFEALRGFIKARLMRAVESNPQLSIFCMFNSLGWLVYYLLKWIKRVSASSATIAIAPIKLASGPNDESTISTC
jgi:hypothetical protein